MPIATPQGTLDFKSVDTITFVGASSNTVIDTTTGSLGVGVDVNGPTSNLHVVGNAFVSSNLTVSGNVTVGDDLTVTGNVTVGDDLTVTGNVTVGDDLTVTGNTFYTNPMSISVDSNVVAEYTGPHSRLSEPVPLKKYPDIDFTLGKFEGTPTGASTDLIGGPYIQGGYEVSSSRSYYDSGNPLFAWQVFDQHGNNRYQSIGSTYTASDGAYVGTIQQTTVSGSAINGEWLQLKTPNKITLKRFTLALNLSGFDGRKAKSFIIAGSDDGTTWTTVSTHTDTPLSGGADGADDSYDTNSTEYYKYHRLIVTHTHVGAENGPLSLTNWGVYGCEEYTPAGDTSIDTTLKSIMNTPQTTGANVYVDAKLTSAFTNQVTGPTPVGTSTTHDNTNKYWELNGTLTSNLSVEANTFLEGDQPHAVSVWFNSSNLEANVSNTCVFSIASEEKLDSVNLDLQSNTWHNLTYTYQGEGGSRVTYLDGRKVAEDQAEDTFGDYPPFAMTGYAQGGYVVSARTEYDTSGSNVVKAFDNNAGTAYRPVNSAYDGSGNLDSGGTFAISSSTTTPGEWIKLEMPHKLVVSYLFMRSVNTGTGPSNFKIFGSNDDLNWDELLSVTGQTTATTGTSNAVNASKGYKYLAVVVTKTLSSVDLQIGEISYYGHRENDLVRLPDPTNVLKYPHVAMTGPAQRGYVASASSNYSATQNYGYFAFSELGSANKWASENAANYNGGSLLYSGSKNLGTNNGGSGTVNGEWLMIEMPHKLKLQSTRIISVGNASEVPNKFIIYGSNDLTGAWSVVDNTYLSTAAAIPVGTVGKTWTVSTASGSNHYKYFGIAVTHTTSSTYIATISNWELYGTGIDSIPIQIGGGNIDKVANFRVYDKFVGEDQALEIWDAQKDYFGRAKSSMTLQKGRLGLGTTEPQGRLAVADEPHNLEEFPPRAMTDYKNYFEGHGVFCASASSWYNQSASGDPVYPWNAFNKGALGFSIGNGYGNNWEPSSGANYNTNTGLFEGSGSNLETSGIGGDWVQLELPYAITLDHMKFMPAYYNDGSHIPLGVARSPKDGHIMASNDGIIWTSIYNWVSRTDFTQLEYTTFKVPGTVTKAYKYFRVVWTRTNSTAPSAGSYDTYASAGEMKFFGTREQGQSVLHDGQLTLTKSLNVPRIGPPLDADDTPRRDRLVVEYNTSTNPTFEGAVRDTSGRGNDGMFYGGVNYSASEKALKFDGSGDYVEGSIHNSAGEWLHSVSMWFKQNTADSYDVLFHLGDQSSGKAISMRRFSSGEFRYNFYDANTEASPATTLGTWYHLAFTYSGGTAIANRKIYLNGVELTVVNSSGTPVVLNLNANEKFTLATQSQPIEGQMNCDISNFKLYDTALTAEEVKTLYDMGRCDEGHHVVNFSKTRVGIGLGDGEAPRAALDVRDVGIFNESIVIGDRGKNYLGVSGVRGGNILVNQGGEFKTGAFTQHASISMYPTATSSNPWHIGAGESYRLNFGINSGVKGYIGHNANGGSLNFTGQHRTFIKDVPFSQAGDLEGLIVSSDQNKYIKMSGGIEVGSNAITTNESLPIVSLSNVVTDKKCFGVISASEDPEERSDVYGNFVTPFDKEKGDTRVYINSVGEGAIWVSNIGGSLGAGDYITTSNVAGYGQKQDSDSLKNYTVAKITMDCDFNPATQPIQQILRSNVIQTYYLGDVHKVKSVPHEFVTTTVGVDDTWSNVSIDPSNVAYAEWSNLEANTQNTYTLTYTQTSNVVYDTKYTLTTTANVTESDTWDRVSIDPPGVTYAEYSNLEANTQSSYSLTFTKTTTDTKTPGAWSALESNTQSLYNEDYYQSVEEEVASDYTGATTHTRVTDVIENELDVHGQIQWEDHSTETEKAYKIRYLDVSGTQTDSANVVHIAAFVGCTYHCG